MVPVKHRVAKRNIEDIKENTKELKMKVFNEDVRLYLTPTEGILANKNTPVWTAWSDSKSPEGLEYKEVPHVRSIRDRAKSKMQCKLHVAFLNFYNIFAIVKNIRKIAPVKNFLRILYELEHFSGILRQSASFLRIFHICKL